MARCQEPECDRCAAWSGKCEMHYARWYRGHQNKKCAAPECGEPVRSKGCPYCEAHYYRIRRGSKDAIAPLNRSCLQCGVPLGKRGGKYCSKKCTSRYNRGTPDKRNCLSCGSSFPSWKQQAYCSDLCRRLALRQLDHRRRAITRGAAAERFSCIEIFERDNWKCQLCGKKTKRSAPKHDPLKPTIDHIVPIARGGAHTRINVQCAHFRCNVRKQASKGGQLRLFG